MINDFEDFCTWMFYIVDEIWQQVQPMFKRPGPAPRCSDSELITMAIIGECRGWDVETEMLNHWEEHRDLFPSIPSQSRFNRRRRNLMLGFNLVRQTILKMLDLAQDKYCVIDSVPIPVVKFYLVPTSPGDWKAHQAVYGRIPTKKETIFGYKLHLLVTFEGAIIDFQLAPANINDLEAGVELLSGHTDLTVVGDKAYVSAAEAARLWEINRVGLLTIPRRNQKKQLHPALKRRLGAVRQIVETVNGQLSQQLNIAINHAHTFWGLCTRLHTKLAAHTLCVYLNRLLGNSNFLQIKKLAFPI